MHIIASLVWCPKKGFPLYRLCLTFIKYCKVTFTCTYTVDVCLYAHVLSIYGAWLFFIQAFCFHVILHQLVVLLTKTAAHHTVCVHMSIKSVHFQLKHFDAASYGNWIWGAVCILTSGVVGRYRSVFSGCQKGPDDELSRHYRLRHPIVLIEFHQEWLSNLDGQTRRRKHWARHLHWT